MRLALYISIFILLACNDVSEKQSNITNVKSNNTKSDGQLDSMLMSGEKYINFGKVTNEDSLDSAYVSHYLVHDNERNLDKHITYVSFSANVSKIILKESFGARIFNAGDLNGDGINPYLPGYRFVFTGQIDQYVKIYSTGARGGNSYINIIVSWFKKNGIDITPESRIQDIIKIT